MARTARSLPSLDHLRGFEAAARRLSFTAAADELFVTQSAVSRQIKSIEDRIGVALFVRRNRGLRLTEAGDTLFRAVSAAFAQLGDALDRLRATQATRTLNITASVAFSALWLVPRLHRFRKRRPDIDVRLSATSELLDLDRDGIDVAVRYCAPEAAPAEAVKLFGVDVVPVCAPSLARDRSRPLRQPQDLAGQVLLHYDDSSHPMPWHAWSTWLEAAGVPDLTPAGALHFSHLDHAIRAAIDGEGVALGIRSVLRDQFAAGQLVMPFARVSPANRGYFAIIAPRARSRAEAREFVDWLLLEADEGAAPPQPRQPRLRAGRRPRWH
jgi:DNA-binding transcriptional LysR family regulator